MKNKLLYFVLLLLLIFSYDNVFAIQTTSETIKSSSYTIDMVYEESSDGSGVPKYEYILNSNDKINATHYVILIKSSTSSKPDLNSFFNCTNTGCSPKASSVVGKLNPVVNGVINVDKDLYFVEGYDYAYIVTMTSSGSTYKFTMSDKPINIKKPSIPSITERYRVTAGGNSITVVSLMPHALYNGSAGIGSHRLVTKLGKVTDNDLIKKLKHNESNAYQTLISYAKSDSEAMQWDRLDSDESFLPFGEYSISEGSLYYVYTYYTDSGTLYKNVEGITLAVGKDGTLLTSFDWDNDFSYGHKFNIILVFLGIFGLLIVGVVFFYIRSLRSADKKDKAKKKGPNYTGLDVSSFDNLGQLSKPTPPPMPTQQNNNQQQYNNNQQYNNYGNNYNNGYNNYNNGYNNYNNNGYNNNNNNNFR